MKSIRITKQFTFDTAHALHGYDGKCADIHGHTYHLDVTVIGIPMDKKDDPKLGMVIDFGELKQIVKQEIVDPFDHALILKEDDPLASQMLTGYTRIILTPYQPTCENMLIDFADKIIRQLPDNIRLHSLKLRETATSFAEWHASDQLV